MKKFVIFFLSYVEQRFWNNFPLSTKTSTFEMKLWDCPLGITRITCGRLFLKHRAWKVPAWHKLILKSSGREDRRYSRLGSRNHDAEIFQQSNLLVVGNRHIWIQAQKSKMTPRRCSCLPPISQCCDLSNSATVKC